MATQDTNQQNQARPQKINDALKILDEAISREGANLKDLVTNDYQHLKTALNDMAPKVKDTIRQVGGQTVQQVQDYAQIGMERSRELAGTIDSRLRSNPWPIIGGVAVGSLALGFLLGRSGSVEVSDELH